MSRLQQDTFIDEEEEYCPLCVEEFDVQDRNFKPCPCGYQICQFCFNNIRTNLNGLCPACRREYREETIEYKAITAEELKAEDSKKKRLASEKRKHEAQKREIEALNRKHLSGLRVIQRNLVYVTGLNPRIREEELLATLRGDQYFGQYGKILKIVVNKRTAQGSPGQVHHSSHQDSQGLGVYVTFSNKNEAEKCIAAVDGSENGDRTLRATYGTTKYCSAYLRNETCPNKNCMFLHEPGEEAESFSRMELSTANSRQNNQGKEQLQQLQQHSAYGHQPQPSRPPQREHHPTAPHHEMARTNSHVGSAAGDADGASALPSTANWAKNPPTPASRPASLVHSIASNQMPSKVSTPSPKDIPASPLALAQHVLSARDRENGKKAPDRTKPSVPSPTMSTSSGVSNANGKSVGVIGQPVPAPVTKPPTPAPAPPPVVVAKPKAPAVQAIPTALVEQMQRMQRMQRAITNPNFRFVLSPTAFSAEEFEQLCKFPPMFDKHGGRRRREVMEKMKKQAVESGGEKVAQQSPAGTAAAPPPMGLPLRGLTPLQQQQHRDVSGQQLQNLQGLGALQQESLLQQQQHQQQHQQQQQSALRTQTPQSLLQQASGQQGFSGAFQGQGQGPMGPPHQGGGHTRQSSRYTFANDNPLTAGTSVNARSNAAHMAEQIRMMPPQQQQQMPHQQQLAQMYGSAPSLGGSLLGSVQQPPPGLKNAPTPPAPGLGGIPMGNIPGLGQFSGMGLGGHHGKSEGENLLLRELLAGNGAPRLGGASSTSLTRGGDGKLDLGDPSILQARVAQPHHQMQQQQQQHQGLQAAGQGQQADFGPLIPTGPRIRVPAPAPATTTTTPAAATPVPVTPIVSDEDFPALAPPQAAVGTGVLIGKKEKKERKRREKKEGRDGKEEETEEVKDGVEKTAEVEKLVEVVEKKEIKTAKVEETLPMVVEISATPGPSKGTEKEERKPPASAFEPSEPSTKRQGPLMMRILSKDSLRSVPSTVSDMTESRPSTPLINKPITGPALADMPLVVTKTKSALKKERLAALKEKERFEAEALAAARANDVQAPLVGRMKKKKEAKLSARKTSDKSTVGDTEDTASERPTSDTVSVADTTDLPLPLPRPAEPEHKTPIQLISEILYSHSSLLRYEMFKPHLPGLKWESMISPEDLLLLRSTAANSLTTAAMPLSLFESRIFVSPAGSTLHGLSAEQEERYVQLEKEQKFKDGRINREGIDALWKPSVPEMEARGEKSAKELEAAVKESRKIAEGYEKKCEKLAKRNRKIMGLV
ncbi:hypothetical protein BZA05DRAFT_401392 [Tricharina praecox]|uniref:uncharacterized protein n=1 Tax=Tricharina praecox TaxID=43433 RepID=UPI00221E911D|nr:uncharacterized protein BZA05DRAFT_401392 [Tricharina praecox]KAI5849739.1 hypothetical protein BZA05DRAFT_401392 [Tricharina praecox]